jgi:thioredoxin reductase
MIIIGGGAAGLSAAMYALGKQLDFLVVYADPGKAGTQQRLTGQADEELLAGAEAVRLFERRITSQSNRTLRDRVADVAQVNGHFHVITQHHGVVEGSALIIATGASPLPLDAPGARALVGYGLGYSVTTHAHLLVGRSVAVIGSSIRALRGVTELARTAAQIYLIAPDSTGLAMPLAQNLRRRHNVDILEGYRVTEVVGSTNIQQLVVEYAGHVRRLTVDAAFVDLGLQPNSGFARRLVRTDQEGFIWVDDRNGTNVPGVFAAGDVTTAFGEQILIAIGDGARAALSAYDYLLPHLPPRETRAMD